MSLKKGHGYIRSFQRSKGTFHHTYAHKAKTELTEFEEKILREQPLLASLLASIRSIESGAAYEAVDLEEHPAVLACVERMRDRLRALLLWAKATGRL